MVMLFYQIPPTSTDLAIYGATRIISHFEKHILTPNIVFLVKGNHLENRNEKKELYHTSDRYEILKKVINEYECNLTEIDNSGTLESAFNQMLYFMFNDSE